LTVLSIVLLLAAGGAATAQRPRARELGVPFHGTPGALNAITDVAGVSVGHTTLIEGAGVRTGVTAIWPRGAGKSGAAFAGWFALNGNGDMTGTHWIEESGFLDSPVLLTNTHSVGVVRDSFIRYQVERKLPPETNRIGEMFWSMPVVAETYDGFLNDTNGFHVKPEHVFQALDKATTGPVAEGAVGGGTGMTCYGFKGGIGTASRIVGEYKVAALVQCNCGRREQLRIGGYPVGEEIQNLTTAALGQPGIERDFGSIIIVIATDAPLLPQQLKRLARRASLGLARTGSSSSNYSGDLFLAFSTANPGAASGAAERTVRMLANEALDPVFTATVDAVEEAITNVLFAAETMIGYQGHKVDGLPVDRVLGILKDRRVLSKTAP
jgi:L-aminopeptidase/D-esterase-like protein